jgi:hypothetical protein
VVIESIERAMRWASYCAPCTCAITSRRRTAKAPTHVQVFGESGRRFVDDGLSAPNHSAVLDKAIHAPEADFAKDSRNHAQASGYSGVTAKFNLRLQSQFGIPRRSTDRFLENGMA